MPTLPLNHFLILLFSFRHYLSTQLTPNSADTTMILGLIFCEKNLISRRDAEALRKDLLKKLFARLCKEKNLCSSASLPEDKKKKKNECRAETPRR